MHDTDQITRARVVRLFTERDGELVAEIEVAGFVSASRSAYGAVTGALRVDTAEDAHWVEVIDDAGKVVATGPLFTCPTALDALLDRLEGGAA